MGKGKNTMPDRWDAYTEMGRIIPGTRFIAFKVPLKEDILRSDPAIRPDEWFGPRNLMDHCSHLGLVIDLTNTNRYYQPSVFLSQGIKYKKLKTEGHVVPKKQHVYDFVKTVDAFLEENKENEKLIGVHCTHGINRTGYMICRYMIQRLDIPADQAISDFDSARGHKQERENYLQDLREAPWINEDPYKESENDAEDSNDQRQPRDGGNEEKYVERSRRKRKYSDELDNQDVIFHHKRRRNYRGREEEFEEEKINENKNEYDRNRRHNSQEARRGSSHREHESPDRKRISREVGRGSSHREHESPDRKYASESRDLSSNSYQYDNVEDTFGHDSSHKYQERYNKERSEGHRKQYSDNDSLRHGRYDSASHRGSRKDDEGFERDESGKKIVYIQSSGRDMHRSNWDQGSQRYNREDQRMKNWENVNQRRGFEDRRNQDYTSYRGRWNSGFRGNYRGRGRGRYSYNRGQYHHNSYREQPQEYASYYNNEAHIDNTEERGYRR